MPEAFAAYFIFNPLISNLSIQLLEVDNPYFFLILPPHLKMLLIQQVDVEKIY